MGKGNRFLGPESGGPKTVNPKRYTPRCTVIKLVEIKDRDS